MKTYYRSLMAINGLMILVALTMIINGLWYNSPVSYTIGSMLGIYWTLSMLYTKKDYDKGELAAQKEEAERVELENTPTQSIYTQLNGLTQAEILWLCEHVENQKTALIQINDQRKKYLMDAINMFSDNDTLKNLQDDARKDLEEWEEFYLQTSTMVANILPKLETIKDAVS